MPEKPKRNTNSFILTVLGTIVFQAMLFCAPLPVFADTAPPELIRMGYVTHEISSHIAKGSGEKGYSYDYLHEIAQYYNWELESVPVTVKESAESLRSGRVDLLSHVHYNEEQEKLVDYSTMEAGVCRVGLTYLRKIRPLHGRPPILQRETVGRFAPQNHIQMWKDQ